MKFLLISLMIISTTSAIDVKFKDCGSTLAKDITISVEPCEAQPCNLKHGTNYSIGITFTPDAASKTIQSIIHGVVAGVPVPFPFDQPDACKSSGLTCPLKSGVQAKYSATLPIKSEYPAIKLYVQWELKDMDAGKDLVCVEIPVAVINGDPNAHKKKVDRNMHWEK